jgi:fructose-1,6-bisphosphatase/inositol monophosphatase family enzyme
MCKADRSPVTVADHEIESALRQVIHERYPHHAIIGEEYGTVRAAITAGFSTLSTAQKVSSWEANVHVLP